MQGASAEARGLVYCPMAPQDDHHSAPHTYIHAGGLCAGRRALARVCGAEALGTALLVLLAAPPTPLHPAPAPPAAVAGLAVAMLVQCLSWVSGAQLNPCVSLAALCCRRMTARRALAELTAQLAGAAVGAAVSARLLVGGGVSVTLPAPGIHLYQAVFVEAMCTLCLVLANCAQWEGAGEEDRTWPLRIGAVVAALATFAGPVTGASMNPARSFGPALLSGQWQHHWVYWAGPLCGAALACLLHRAMCPPAPRPHAQRKPEPPATMQGSTVTLSTFNLK